MASSSVFVVSNSLRLRRFAPPPATADFLTEYLDEPNRSDVEPARQMF
ncbi:hypothetical protein ABZ297_28150 [Nonomuraea sp. NPDC005983]